MLPEWAKQNFIRATEKIIAEYGDQAVIDIGPKKLVESVITGGVKLGHVEVVEVIANREEAEQFVAGLLGLT